MAAAVSFDSTLNSPAADNLLRKGELVARDPGTAELIDWVGPGDLVGWVSMDGQGWRAAAAPAYNITSRS